MKHIKQFILALAVSIALILSLGMPPANAAKSIEWKPGLSHSQMKNKKEGDWVVGGTQTWRSGIRSDGAYVVQPVKTTYRITWVDNDKPECDTWKVPNIRQHLVKVTFRTQFFDGFSGGSLWAPGGRTIPCPQDGYEARTYSYSKKDAPIMVYSRTGRAPIYKATARLQFAGFYGANDKTESWSGRLYYRGRTMPLPW